jgi:uncharacterized damage-inducible protein DinB
MSQFSLEAVDDLTRHMEWADATVWQAVLAHDGARGDQRLRDLLVHLHMVQRFFLLVWRGESILPLQSFSTFDALVDLQQRAASYYPDLRSFQGSLDEAALTRRVTMPFVAEEEKRLGMTFQPPTLAETIVQVTSHSTYHRGQVNARLREVGGAPPLVDYIAWLYFGRPAPDWSVSAMSAAE